MTYKFQSTLVRPEGTGTWTFLNVPLNTAELFDSKGHIKVKGAMDGEPFISTLMPDGSGGHFLVVNRDIRDRIGKNAGDTVSVELEEDCETREILVPDDFQAALSLNEKASMLFEKLPPSHKKRYIDHINGARAVETRMSRIEKAVEMIAAGRNA